MLNGLYGLGTHAIYREDNWQQAAPVVGHVGGAVPEDEALHSDTLYLVKTHELPSDTSPAIYLVRDGRDVLVSYAHFIVQRSGAPGAASDPAAVRDTLRALIERRGSVGGWGPHVKAWLCDRQPAPALVRFEDLVAAPVQTVVKAMTSLSGGPIANHRVFEPPSFAYLHHLLPDFFRSGRVGGWKTEMPDDLHALFWEHYAEAMSLAGYTCRSR